MHPLIANNPTLLRLSESGRLDALRDDAEACDALASVHPSELGRELVSRGLVDEADYTQALASHLQVPYLVPDPSMVQPEALQAVPAEVLSEHNALPMMLAEGWLTLVLEAFDDPSVVARLEKQTGYRIQALAAPGGAIRRLRAEVLGEADAPASNGRGSALDTLALAGDGLGVEILDDEPDDEEELVSVSDQSPAVRLVSELIREAAQSGASDIHIEPHGSEFRTRFRVDGELRESMRTTSRLLPAVVSRIKIISGLDISQRRLPQDGAMSVKVDGRAVDLRVSTMATKFGEKVVMRLVDRDASVAGLETLGFEPGMLASLRGSAMQANGIVLVTGPTGSGKSTTLYALLAELLSEKRNISTVEDPVERKLLGTNQFQVNVPAGFTFPTALRSLLRQDPDVLMVGEVRDTETARLAMEAALTGHLVLTTLHTNDALTAVPRLINMGVEPYLVAASLRAVLAQRLVRRLCEHCRQPVELTPAQREIVQRLSPDRPVIGKSYESPGCGHCRQTGHRGRAGVFELVTLDESLLSAVVQGGGVDTLREQVRARGQAAMLDDGLWKVEQGVIGLAGLFEALAPAEAAAADGGVVRRRSA